MKKIILIVVGILVGIGIVVAIIFGGMIKGYKAHMEQVNIQEINLASLVDGLYYGTSDAGGVVSVEVMIKVKNHVITEIELLEHKNGRGELANGIVDRVITDQSLMVDTITGATSSSYIILEAIQIALNNNPQ